MKEHSGKSMPSAPPMVAFQCLTTSHTRARRRRLRRRPSVESVPKSPIDPLDGFDIYCDDDNDICFHSDSTDDDRSIVTEDESLVTITDERVDGSWTPGVRGDLERVCFYALCCLLFDSKDSFSLPPPHRMVVTGLWSNVVLPSLLGEVSNHIPALIAQDVWDALHSEMQFITEDTNSNVTIAHPDYSDNARNLEKPVNATKWRRKFATFLQDSLDGDQPFLIQVYAAQVIIPLWISLGKVSTAASLLLQPAFVNKEWALLMKQENMLQITQRHIKFLELYLSKLPPSTTKWQEALALYQVCHTTLWHHMGCEVNESSVQTLRSGHSSCSSVWSKHRSKQSPGDTQTVNHKQLLVLGKCLFLLGNSLNAVLTELPGQDASLTLLWRCQAEFIAEAVQVLSEIEDEKRGETKMKLISNILSAKAWLSLSSSCGIFTDSAAHDLVDIDSISQFCGIGEISGESDEIKCLNVAKTLLHELETLKKSHTLLLMFVSVKAEVEDSRGRWLYNNGRYEETKLPFEDAVNLRRQAIGFLEVIRSDSSTFLLWGSHLLKECHDETEAVCLQLCFEAAETEQQIRETDIALSQSLEYAALAHHACGLSSVALSLLQEALGLVSVHLGRTNKVTARLNSAMATINEDLSHWTEGLSRHREALRINMQVLSGKDPGDLLTTECELLHFVLETLTSMGNIYRILGDHDKAVGCNWKIATMTKKEWESLSRTSGDVAFWGFEGHVRMTSDLRAMPLPVLELDEQRLVKTPSITCPPQRTPKFPKRDVFERENAILSQSAQAYQTILRIFDDKAKIVMPISKSSAGVVKSDLPLLLVSSYRLGMIQMFWGDFPSAMLSLERCLHAVWSSESILSDSSSEDESEEKHSRAVKDDILGALGNEGQLIDDERLYHALGICRAKCGDYARSVRFYLTALKCARRHYGVDSNRASQILYDAAISYWYLKEYEKAEEFWSTCLRMRSQFKDDHLMESSNRCIADSVDTARVLYNIGASLCALGRYSEPRTEESLGQAKLAFENLFDSLASVEVASCLFYLALVQIRKSCSGSTALLNDPIEYLDRASSIFKTLDVFGTISYDYQNGPLHASAELQAHILFMEADALESLGRMHRALDTYNKAVLLYGSLDDTRWNVFVSSVLNKIGKLHVRRSCDVVALDNFEEALRLRKEYLGGDHEAVGDTIHEIAKINSRLGNHDIALELFHEALRIQIHAQGTDGSAVAITLQMIAFLHFRQGNYEMAMEKLTASLSIRKNRVKLISRANALRFVQIGALADEFLALWKESIEQQGDPRDCKINLQDDLLQEEVGLAVVYHCMGNVWVKLGELSQARECFERSLHVRRNHPASTVICIDQSMTLHVCDTLHNLGCLFELQGEFGRAISYFSTSLKLKHNLLIAELPPEYLEGSYDGTSAIDERYLNSKGSMSVGMTMHRLGTLYFRIGDKKTAMACLYSALRIQRKFLGLYHFKVANTLADLACVLRQCEGKNDEARICYTEACEIRKLRDRYDADVVHLLYRIGRIHDANRDFSLASSFYRHALRAYGRHHINAFSRRLCVLFSIKGSNLTDDYADVCDILAKDGFQAATIEQTDDKISASLTTISRAIRESSQKRIRSIDSSVMLDMDLHSPDCLISLELYILSVFELIRVLSERYAIASKRFAAHALHHMEQLGADGMWTSQEVVTFRMLCLIQE